MKNPAPYRYDIVGSFLRTKAIHEARSKFEAGEISAEELTKVEDAEITGLVEKEENVGLHAVTDGEYRRSFWHMDFLWDLTGTQKVKSEHFSVAFKGFQPKAETVKIVDKLDFPDDHPFLKHFAFLSRAAKANTASGNSNFADVDANAYYASAVKWAVDNGITNGISSSLFGPGSSCTRAQIVTFLYRMYQGK